MPASEGRASRLADQTLDRDEQRLAELGYKQELTRGWSRFSNFAISFTIISVLAGCFTTYAFAWNAGGLFHVFDMHGMKQHPEAGAAAIAGKSAAQNFSLPADHSGRLDPRLVST